MSMLLFLEDMIQRMLIICRFQIAADLVWENRRNEWASYLYVRNILIQYNLAKILQKTEAIVNSSHFQHEPFSNYFSSYWLILTKFSSMLHYRALLIHAPDIWWIDFDFEQIKRTYKHIHRHAKKQMHTYKPSCSHQSLHYFWCTESLLTKQTAFNSCWIQILYFLHD